LSSLENITLVFLRAPLLGKVKTRLSKAIPEDLVLDLYKGFLGDIIDEVSKISKPLLYCYPSNKIDFVSDWIDHKYKVLPQSGDDIGKKMQRAFNETFSRGYKKALLIGTDIPMITGEIILRAYEMLENYDCVLGPSEDGGYYLIGFREDSFETGCFENIKWSTPDVYDDTLKILNKRSKKVYNLPILNDIDTIDDLKELVSSGGSTGNRTGINLVKIKEYFDL
jgi:rSAM/selenodomain-associated transferase 1